MGLAAEADYRTSPNPMVGAVVLDEDGNLAGEGFHARAGEPHAEVNALRQAGDKARGGTLYVNLEPCNHQGRTPPCVDAVLAAKVRRVVISMLDPDPRTKGEGMERLLESGVEVSVGAGEREAERLNEFYLHHRRTGRPFVTAKFATSLDGKIATRSGDSRWITGEEARAHAHVLRHRHDAVLVGVNTVLKDDPELTARTEGDPRQPLRVVLDRRLRTPPEARLAGPNTLVFASPDADPEKRRSLEAKGVEVSPTGTDPKDVLEELGRRDLLSVLVEGGAEVHGSFFDAHLVQRVAAYLAPKLIGGTDAPGPVGGRGAPTLAEALELKDVEVLRLGPDLLISGRTPY